MASVAVGVFQQRKKCRIVRNALSAGGLDMRNHNNLEIKKYKLKKKGIRNLQPSMINVLTRTYLPGPQIVKKKKGPNAQGGREDKRT